MSSAIKWNKIVDINSFSVKLQILTFSKGHILSSLTRQCYTKAIHENCKPENNSSIRSKAI
ncbi:hypothetical protein BpHYR1_050305 [Brachionus plicatilis]|uniref:Uncharacterized protein n=1 Tax=Brachionus plicatilis TaxID=10195 RepID=A0A3M7R3P2_BRAPC|nr:hypothetical protein BpHYR1_050305 [Brachionus plicatilis]